MRPQPVPAAALLAAHGLQPTDEELAVYEFLAPMLRAMVDELYAVEMADER